MLIPFGVFSAAGAGGGGAGGDYELISTSILGSSATSVTFTSGGTWAGYKHLQIRASFKSDSLLGIRFNSDTGTNYISHRLQGNGSTVTSGSTSGSYAYLGRPETLTNAFASAVIDIMDFSNTSKNTTARSLAGTKGTDSYIILHSGLWINTSAVTSLDIISASGNLNAASRFSLYGIRG